MEDKEIDCLIDRADRAGAIALAEADAFLAALRLTPAESAFAREQAATAVVNIRRACAGTFLAPGVVVAALMAGSLMAERIEREIEQVVNEGVDVAQESTATKNAA